MKAARNILSLLVAVASVAFTAAAETDAELSGGETTVFDDSREAFAFPAANLTAEHRAQFFVGNSFFNENWVAAPASTPRRDGLGPLFVTRSCSACHFKDGRSAPPAAGELVEKMAVRLVAPGSGEHGGPRPDAVYGGQLQTSALPVAQAEAEVVVREEFIHGEFADGEPFTLRRMIFAVTNLGYGAFQAKVVVSPLVAPTMIGLGLLEAVPEATLRQLAAEKRGGTSGKLNLVWDETAQQFSPGRFGWKAEQPTVRQQCAAAFNGDMGLTTALFPKPNHTAAQRGLEKIPNGGEPEVDAEIFEAVVNYSRTLAVPARRDATNETVLRGEKLFHQAGCASCHAPKLETGGVADLPELSRQTIRPYTDLLLHDMGEALSDGRTVFAAGPRDWRTAPLWGVGLVKTVNGHTFYLHDGRARNLTEAILWHGGEAEPARENFRKLNRADREAVIRFLESL